MARLRQDKPVQRRTERGAVRKRSAGAERRALAKSRASRSAERREAILAAALEEFSVNGFAATRLDDVARRAGVAKGTIYLYFKDKESLFQDLVRTMLTPLVDAVEAAPAADLPFRAVAERVIDMFIHEIYGTRRKDVIRLIIAEGPRFPKLAEFYYREVLERIMSGLRALIMRAIERGELDDDVLARFPQLLVAPGVVAIFWNALFGRFSPLDVSALMRAHLDIVLGPRRPR